MGMKSGKDCVQSVIMNTFNVKDWRKLVGILDLIMENGELKDTNILSKNWIQLYRWSISNVTIELSS